jgi:hypothetical protein
MRPPSKPQSINTKMIYKALILSALLLLNFHILSGQVIHYDYDESGNRINRYIILNKGNTVNNDTSKKDMTDNQTVESEKNNKIEEYEDKLEEFTIKIYPNPTQSSLNVMISGLESSETVDYQLFSQTGLLLVSKRKNSCQFTVFMEKYPDGLYVLKLAIKDKISQWKILKE